jgi:Glyoxalase-like domain
MAADGLHCRGDAKGTAMAGSAARTGWDRQLPRGEEIFLDHVGHFVRDAQAASEALLRAGFASTPVSVQSHPDPAGGPPVPTGTGNVTAMFQRGYLEILFKTANTELGREFDAALAQYSGIHLAAFSISDAEAAHRRLASNGFPMRPLVSFERPVTTATGVGTAAFSVVRVERGAMAEGRIQLLTHRTEDMVWQKRWLAHPNGVIGLIDLLVVAADFEESAERFSRFTGREAKQTAHGRCIRLDRGTVEIVTPNALAALLPELRVPRLPFLAAYGLRVASLANAEKSLSTTGIAARRAGKALIAPFPSELGLGAWCFAEQGSDTPWHG